MDPEQLHEKDIFAAALARPSGEEREAYIRQACGDDAKLQARIRALLEAREEVGDFLETPAIGSAIPPEGGGLAEESVNHRCMVLCQHRRHRIILGGEFKQGEVIGLCAPAPSSRWLHINVRELVLEGIRF